MNDYQSIIVFLCVINLIISLVIVAMVFDMYEDFIRRRRGVK